MDQQDSPPPAPAQGEEAAISPNLIVLPAGVEHPQDVGEQTLGVPGRPLDKRAPFLVGLMGALGVAVAYFLVRGLSQIGSVLAIIGMSLFLAIGLSPLVAFLERHGQRRLTSVLVVVAGFLGLVGAFVIAAVPPVSREIHDLIANYPRYRHDLITGRGWFGRLAVRFHLTGYITGHTKLRLPASALLGAGKMLIGVGVAVTSVVALTIYFLIALPGVRTLWLSLVPRSRRERALLLTDETFNRIGGFMLGNLFTSLISAVFTYVWLVAWGIPYPILLALFVAIFDLIPIIGSTIAGIVVSLVALTKGLPIGIATAAYYLGYRLLEDYLINPRVMKRTVSVSPGLTIIATLIGGSLLGLLGALIAIPTAATIQLLLEEVVIPGQNGR